MSAAREAGTGAAADRFSVALVGPYPPPYGGLSVHVERLHRRLLDLGIRSRVHCQPLPAPVPAGVVPAAFRFRWYLWVLERAWRCDADIVHFYEGWRWAPAVLAVLLGGKRVVMAYHNQQVTGAMWDRTARVARWASRRLVRHPRVWWVAATPAVRDQLAEMGVEVARVTLAPAYLPPPPPLPGARLPERLAAFLAAHSPVLSAYAFDLSRTPGGVDVYGADQCVELARALRAEFPRLGVVLRLSRVADEAYRRELEARVTAHGLADHVLFATEPLADATLLWSASDVFLRPTCTDGDAVAVREALGLRVPVVASDVAARPAGTVLHRAGDTTDLVRAVREVLVRHDDHVRALATVAVPDNFPPLLALYRAIARTRSHPS